MLRWAGRAREHTASDDGRIATPDVTLEGCCAQHRSLVFGLRTTGDEHAGRHGSDAAGTGRAKMRRADTTSGSDLGSVRVSSAKCVRQVRVASWTLWSCCSATAADGLGGPDKKAICPGPSPRLAALPLPHGENVAAHTPCSSFFKRSYSGPTGRRPPMAVAAQRLPINPAHSHCGPRMCAKQRMPASTPAKMGCEAFGRSTRRTQRTMHDHAAACMERISAASLLWPR